MSATSTTNPRLSVIIITRNEAHNIAECLRSVAFADEIIVMDSGSTDATLEICRQFTDHVYSTDWPGYGSQKNRALEKAHGEWVLSLDADERVTETLVAEMTAVIAEPANYAAYVIPFHSKFLGQFIRFGDWHAERHLRLFKRSCGKFNSAVLHENLQIDGKIGSLKNPIIHEPYQSLEELLDKINRYSTAGAKQRRQQGKTGGFASALLHGSWAFLRSYIFRLGFLDGRAGFVLAVSIAECSYYCYLKMA